MANKSGASVFALSAMVPTYTGYGNGSGTGNFLEVIKEVAEMEGWSASQLIGIARCKMAGVSSSFECHDEDTGLVVCCFEEVRC